LFPYIYIVWILMGYYRHVDLVIFVLNQAVYFPLIWICALATLFRTILRTSGEMLEDDYNDKLTPERGVMASMIIKVAQIPIYIFHFIVGVMGLFMSVWGIGFILFAIIIDLFTIAVSGTFLLAGIIGLYRKEKISKKEMILYGIASYVYCVDVVISIYICIKVNNIKNNRRKMKK